MKNSLFLLVFGFVFLGTFMFLNIVFFRYEGRMSIAILPKTLIGAVSLEEITSLSADIFTSFSFLENVLLTYPQLEKYNAFVEKEENTQTTLWKKRTDTSLRGSVVELRYSANDAYEAEQVLRASANVLIKNISVYYNAQKDIKVEIFERPVITKRNFFLDILISFVVGLFVSLVAKFFLKKKLEPALEWKPFSVQSEIRERLYGKRDGGKKKRDEEKENVSEEKEGDGEQKEVMYQEVETSFPKEEKKESYQEHFEKLSREKKDDYKIFHQQLPGVSFEKKEVENEKIAISERTQRNNGFVPMNLPIILEEESVPLEKEKETESFQEEPTNEEYKRRLNELLKGKMIV
ncbi:MAG: hypothetical protein EOM19_03215 [Candidatus Moranbacteria bacterium]|nr:hypothetical protein [Candidatus Moranbacteria bacterium]